MSLKQILRFTKYLFVGTNSMMVKSPKKRLLDFLELLPLRDDKLYGLTGKL